MYLSVEKCACHSQSPIVLPYLPCEDESNNKVQVDRHNVAVYGGFNIFINPQTSFQQVLFTYIL